MRTLSLPCLSSSLHTHNFSPPSSSLIFTSHRRFHFLTPCSSLRQTKKQQQQQQLTKINTAPSGFKRLFSPKPDDDDDDDDGDKKQPDSDTGTALKGTLLAGVLLLGIVGGFAAVGYIYRDPINSFLNQLSLFIEGPFHIPIPTHFLFLSFHSSFLSLFNAGYGPTGYAIFVAVYAGLEVPINIQYSLAVAAFQFYYR